MPEAAEVETVRRGLLHLRGQKLQEALLLSEKLGAKGKEGSLLGLKLHGVLRQGKLLGMEFEGGLILTSHLRMTGAWLLGEHHSSATRAVLQFSQDAVSFVDPRGFATMDLRSSEDWRDGLGPDLLSLQESWSLSEKLALSRRSTKATLLDQSVVSGVGNYLADESLWSCQISPDRPSKENSPQEWQELYLAAKGLALQVLGNGGVSLRDYRNVEGQEGLGASLLRVYGRAGKPCLRCGRPLAKKRVAGRGTTFCGFCQKQ